MFSSNQNKQRALPLGKAVGLLFRKLRKPSQFSIQLFKFFFGFKDQTLFISTKNHQLSAKLSLINDLLVK